MPGSASKQTLGCELCYPNEQALNLATSRCSPRSGGSAAKGTTVSRYSCCSPGSTKSRSLSRRVRPRCLPLVEVLSLRTMVESSSSVPESPGVVGSTGTASSTGVIGSAGTVASAGVIGSAGTVASTGVIGSAGVLISAGVVGSAAVVAGLGNAGCVACVACVGCVNCVGCVACVGCVGLRGAVGAVGRSSHE